MRDRAVRVLCTGDLHMGRFPSKVPEDAPSCSVEHVWSTVVEVAIDRSVDAVVLTGDVIDNESGRFEAFGPLQRGVRRLAEAEIDTIAVAGNHDYDALPRLYDLVNADRFYLIGRGGRWQEHVVRRGGDEILRVVGWSFPERHVHASPLPQLGLERGAVPTVAAIHGDLGVSESPYVPLTMAELTDQPVDAWLLGHIHEPEVRARNPLVLYPGSLQPLDPGEEDTHGAWLIEIESDRRVEADHVPLASLTYASLEVDISEEDAPEDLESCLVTAIRDDLATRQKANAHLRRAVYRVTLVGRSEHPQEWVREAKTLARRLTVPREVVDAHVDAIVPDVRPAIDLETLAEQGNPAGVLARHLLRLERRDEHEATEKLLDRLREKARTVRQATGYSMLDESAPDREMLRREALRQARLLLDELLSQRD